MLFGVGVTHIAYLYNRNYDICKPLDWIVWAFNTLIVPNSLHYVDTLIMFVISVSNTFERGRCTFSRASIITEFERKQVATLSGKK